MKDNSLQNTHKYLKLAGEIRRQIQEGSLRPGDRLPTFAEMQAKHGLGQWTLERAYAVLESENLITREPNRGFFVTAAREPKAVRVIGMATGIHPGLNPYYFRLLQGVQKVAYSEKVEVLLLHDASEIKWEKVDGVLLTDFTIQVPVAMPAVSVTVPQKEMLSVLADDFQGCKDATQYLISLGHRRIGFLNLNKFIGSSMPGHERLNGYRAALEKAGIEQKKAWVRPLLEPWELPASFAELGYQKMKAWLQEDWHKLGCTALLVYNDDTASGVLRALQEANIQVPEEVSLMGFDGTEQADQLHPKLSTVEVPLQEIGARGLELLLQMMQQPISQWPPEGNGGLQEVLPVRLKIQESTAKVKS